MVSSYLNEVTFVLFGLFETWRHVEPCECVFLLIYYISSTFLSSFWSNITTIIAIWVKQIRSLWNVRGFVLVTMVTMLSVVITNDCKIMNVDGWWIVWATLNHVFHVDDKKSDTLCPPPLLNFIYRKDGCKWTLSNIYICDGFGLLCRGRRWKSVHPFIVFSVIYCLELHRAIISYWECKFLLSKVICVLQCADYPTWPLLINHGIYS